MKRKKKSKRMKKEEKKIFYEQFKKLCTLIFVDENKDEQKKLHHFMKIENLWYVRIDKNDRNYSFF